MSIFSVPSFHVFRVTMSADLIMVSDDEFNSLHVPLVNDTTGSAVIVQPSELSLYRYEEVSMSIQKIVDPSFSLRPI